MTTKGGPVRFGVIGCGTIGYWVYLRVLQKMKGAQLIAACDPSAVARQRASGIVKIPIGADHDEILTRTDVDAVVVCSPSGTHAELAVAALEAGKHVFIEKPIATSMEGAQRVLDAAKGSSMVAAIGFNRRRHPLFEQARRLIADSELGQIHAIQSALCEPLSSDKAEWRNDRAKGGGVLFDLASHHVDLFRWFLDDEVRTVDCTVTAKSTDVDTTVLSLTMKSGVATQSFFSFRSARADYLEFIGERGTLLLDKHRSSMSVRVSRKLGYGTRNRVVVPDAPVARWRSRRLINPSNDPSYERTLDSFIGAIHGNGGVSATLSDGTKSLEVILAAESSAMSGNRVTLES